MAANHAPQAIKTLTAGDAVVKVVDAAGTNQLAIDASGRITVLASGNFNNASVSATGSAVPASATAIGGSDGTNLRIPRVFDLDSGAGTEYSLSVNLRRSASGGSVELLGQGTMA